jgi:hypothetical protein
MVERNSFRKITNEDGSITYIYNGKEVSKEEFDTQRAAAKETQTELLGGITIEEKRKQIQEKIAAAKAAKNKNAKGGMINKYAKGGSVHKNKSKMITKRGWGASRKT